MNATCTRDSTDSVDTIGTLDAILAAALNDYGFMFRPDPYTGEEIVIYRVRDIDLRAGRIDSNSATRSFGASIDFLRRETDQCQSSMTLAAILERAAGKDVAFAFSCATDPILARLLVIASLVVYLISRMDALFVVHNAV
ncbi:hypothetical protein LXA43DRAFT_1093888 [Ganoderma leucocontextum]|nr:hypothetical protein LXA43DRAFT_1093888 [Ganoderma leucocontextum]